MGRPRDCHTKQLTAEERQRVRILRSDALMSYGKIQETTGFTKGQIRNAIKADSADRGVRTGRPPQMSQQQQLELVEFVTLSKKNRRMTFLDLALTLFNQLFGEYAIRYTLRRLGFKRHVARRKPPISEANRRKRLEWAESHKHWTPEQWGKVLWTDETWINGGHHRKQYVTRRIDEAWDETCIVERYQRKGGWMFWGCFSGLGKGPGIFWEKDWGKINAETYQQRTVPVIDGWIQTCKQQLGEDLILMQDGAPGHNAASTKQDLRDRGIQLVEWPPYSPDMNPIEACWNWMKDYIEDKWGDVEKVSYDELRRQVNEAWEKLPIDFLQELLASMPKRCQDVIDAEGRHTKW